LRLIINTVNLFFHNLLHYFSSITGCKNNQNKILLVRLDAIGDFILWLDSAKEFRRLYPGSKITLCCNAVWSDLAALLPYWDDILPIELRRFNKESLYRWKLLGAIKRAEFDIAIQPTFSRNFHEGDPVIRASRSHERIGSTGDLSNISEEKKAVSDREYTRLVPACSGQMMELERNSEFISNLSGKAFKAGPPKLKQLITLPDNLKVIGEYIIIFPGASWHGRQWPTDFFAAVLTHLHDSHGLQAVLCGSSTERTLCQVVLDKAQVATVNLAGKTTLPELLELIRGARLLISNETSAIHLAAAAGVRSVCILGGGHYGRFLPYPETVDGIKPLVALKKMPCFNCNWQCSQEYDQSGAVPCISGISVEEVINLAEQALSTPVKITTVQL
jgi:ADP-heptose:LPS heptosyltransferase